MLNTTTTEPLTLLVRSITLQKRTGLLCVERFGEGGREQGKIYFEGGRPMGARAGQDTGRAAFQRIHSWKQITCSFESVSRPYPSGSSVTPPADTLQAESTGAGTYASSRRVTQPLFPSAGSLEGSSGSRLSGRHRPIQSLAPRSGSETTPPEAVQKSSETDTFQRRLSWFTDRPSPGHMAVFKAASHITLAKSLRLMERRDRIIFILLDGKRNVQDIARLTHYTETEVELVLAYLAKHSYVERVVEQSVTSTVQTRMADLLADPRNGE